MDLIVFEKALEIIKAHDTIIIYRHSNPDGDALGSQVGLCEIIKDNYPEKRVFIVGDESDRYGFIVNSAMDNLEDALIPSSLSIIPASSISFN